MIMETPEEYEKREFQRFQDGALNETSKLDNIIFVVGTGTFILSINYIVGLKGNYLRWPLLLVSSWITLLISIIVHAFGYRYSAGYHLRVVQEIKEWADKGHPLPFIRVDRTKDHKIIEQFNNWSLWLLIVGLALLTVFASYNFVELNKTNIHVENTYLTINNQIN